MAIMIPETPHHFEPASLEGVMFDALTQLPDEYYVFHSFKIIENVDNVIHESETDFLLYHKDKGILCLEAKAGKVSYSRGAWRYGSGDEMSGGGPFNQASTNKWKLFQYIKKSRFSQLLNHCKFLHAVWFPSITKADINAMALPSDGDKSLVMTKESLLNPQVDIDRIFDIELPNNKATNITTQEHNQLINEILCPRFEVFPSKSLDSDLKKIVFHRLLKEQSGILNFLDEQKSAIINGAAGTGKTMIALEKAKRHASEGHKTLFLCYNVQLKNFLLDNYRQEGIDFYTIAGFACKACNTATPDYPRFKRWLEDMYFSLSFPYMHIVVDEGQDFGLDNIEECAIMDTLKTIITDNDTADGSFFVFYDKLQLVQASHMPKFIEDADCKLTLYRNCRNTENIATTSLRPITIRKPKLLEGAVKGTPARLHYCADGEGVMAKMDAVINELIALGLKDIVILTCKTEGTSILCGHTSNGKFRNKYRFTTCRKFKGLEADAIVLIDIDASTFVDRNVLLYYVGASRARLRLEMITTMSDDDCVAVLETHLNKTGKRKRPKRDLAMALNAIGVVITTTSSGSHDTL